MVAKSMEVRSFDPTLVEHPARLLDVLNKTERLQNLLAKKDERGYTLLHSAVEKNQPESLKCLLIKHANPNVHSATGTNEVTPLHIASNYGHLACVQLLVQAGADILSRDRQLLTPSDHANISGQNLCLDYLNDVIAQRQRDEQRDLEYVLMEVERKLATGNVLTLNHWSLFNELFPITMVTPASHEYTQLESMMYRHCMLINNQTLVKVMSRVAKNIPVSLRNASLLHAACLCGLIELTKLLIHKFPKIMLTATSEGFHSLHIAVAFKKLEIVKFLTQTQVLQNRVTVPTRFGAATLSGHTVLHFAVAINDLRIMAELLKHHRELQLNIDACECGYTALHLAVYLDQFQAVEVLLQMRANLNTRLDSKSPENRNLSVTPLAQAAVNKSHQIFTLLLKHGANDEHHDALKVCHSSNHEMLIPLLGSLIRLDDSKKLVRKDHPHIIAAIDWSHLNLGEIHSSWITDALSCSTFLLLQNIKPPKRFECVTSINLCHNGLTKLPVEVFKLPNLSTLNASNNQLETLLDLEKIYNSKEDSCEWSCSNLRKVILSENSLTCVPQFLFQLPELVYLDISNNRIMMVPFEMWTAPKLYYLNCSHNLLKEIPTNWPYILDTCCVIEITPQVDSKEEREGSNVVSDSQLQDRLNISNANLPIEWDTVESRFEGYESLEGLAILNLSDNQISMIPDNFACLCPKLIRLDLSFNHLSQVSFPKSFPSSLKHINLAHNPLVEIDSEHSPAKPLPCTNPHVLNNFKNMIHLDHMTFCCHRQHTHLVSLGILDLNNCQLKNINFCSPAISLHSGKGKKHDSDLLVQDIMCASAGKQPQNIQALVRLVCPLLTRLILSHNHLTKVPDSICIMTSLNSLDLSHNDIIELPAALGQLGNLWEFPLEGLKLISPPYNIIERGKTKDIIGFLRSQLQKAQPYHHMKLMLVGKAARGKTTLLQRISERAKRGSQENLPMFRIVISDWTYNRKVKESQTNLKSITFMTWDFEGEEEYYSTYQCFLTRRTLYLLVWNVTHGIAGAKELKPWLLNIQGRAPHSPVIIVGTHLDKVSSRQEGNEMEECQRFIASTYGSAENRREGFPQIMLSSVVSCKSGKNINGLRDSIFDIASQVKENTVAGRGIGFGRIPEYRLLMDQLVPASYLQLKDTVQNIALSRRLVGKTPVLTYKDFRDAVFADPRTQISRNTADRELEQAVRFLHDCGTLLHYEDPLLSDFYFLDPQWLCGMLAHIVHVAVMENSPLNIRDGVVQIADFPIIFRDEAFPMRWQREYIRLLTTFEVAVELGGGDLLIPSALPCNKPILPQAMFPEDLKMLPPLRHTYIVPFVPNGFWPRLMSRILTDSTILQLAREGCGVTDEDVAQLSWVKWRTGLILQYGNLTLLTIEELTDGLFPGVEMDIKILKDYEWELQREIKSGIDVIVPDIFPILKHPEIVKARRQKMESTIDRSHLSAKSCDLSVKSYDPSSGSRDKCMESHDQPTPLVGVAPEDHESCVSNKLAVVDEEDLEFEKLAKKQSRLFTTDHDLSLTKASSQQSLTEEHKTFIVGLPPKGSIREENPTTASEERFYHASHKLKPTLKERLKIDEEKNDVMRAGLLSKVVDHIALLVDQWFISVRPRHLIVPCPHCTANMPYETIILQRSFSVNEAVQLKKERTVGEKEGITTLEMQRIPSRQSEHTLPLNRPKQRPSIHHKRSGPGLCQDCYRYAFYYDSCVIAAMTIDSVFCPAHGSIPLQYMAPDTLFLTQGNILVNSCDVVKEDLIGHSAFATFFKGTLKRTDRQGGDTSSLPVALKALTKGWEVENQESDLAQDQEIPTRLPSRHSILEGFRNLKKELSILSRLKHSHVIQIFGVILNPMTLVLELAPKGSLDTILQSYSKARLHLQCNVTQAVVIQVASAIQYIHSCYIIYRDVKSRNVLVWQFPDPQDFIPNSSQLGMETVFVKVSDYDISQFAATGGARGLVGTPGYMAPEIIKYHGREVYTEQVDIFSFGMLIYEMITFHIPFDNLTSPQANQANERGVRPSLTKKDLPCRPLLRELMVWCWQEHPDDRPTASQIITETKTEQFLRLLDGIRVSNGGKVMATCVRIVSLPLSSAMSRNRSSPNTLKPDWYDQQSESHDGLSESHDQQPERAQAGDARSHDHNNSVQVDSHVQVTGTQNAFENIQEAGTEVKFNQESDSELSEHMVKHKPNYIPPGFMDDVRSKLSLSGRPVSTDSSMSLPQFWKDELVFEVWVASNEAHRSVATVMEYNGQFLSVDDIEVGNSPVLCMCVVRGDKVWMGLKNGYLKVFNTASRSLCAQAWVKPNAAILCIIHISVLKRVYVGLGNGSILAYNDDGSSIITFTAPAQIKLLPLCEYIDPNQISACLLAVPKIRPLQMSTTSFEIWVGQREGRIAILDAETLQALKLISIPLDASRTPNFVAYLTSDSVYSVSSSSDQAGNRSTFQLRKSETATSGLETATSFSCVNIYGALLHGQYVTMWNADSKMVVNRFNCNTHLEKSEECSISALHCASLQLYVGLTSGKILVLNAVTFECVCTLNCHRSHISSLLTIDLAHLQQDQETSSVYRDKSGSSGSMSHSGNPSLVPVGDKMPYRPSFSSTQSVSNTRHLLSFGTGFRSYYDGPESKPHLESGFLLIWDAERWGGDI